MRKTRLDILKLDSVEVTSQGFLKFPVYAGRVGIQIYQGEEGRLIKEFRPPEEVFSEPTMKSLKGIVVTNEHPAEMVNLENVKALQKGFGSDVVEKVDNKFLKTFVTITDKDLIEEIQNGKVEVSLGYDVEVEEKQGEFEGQYYDCIQRNIINNHLAVVKKGRAGEEVRLRLDRFDGIMIDESTLTRKDKMSKIKIGDKEFEVSDECKKAYDEEMKKVKDEMSKKEEAKDEAEEKKKEADQEVEKEKEKNDSLQAKLDSAEEKIKDLKSKRNDVDVAKLVKERMDLHKTAINLLDKETVEKLDSMDDMEIKKAVIKNSTKKEINFDGKSDTYINARFDAVVEMYEEEVAPTKTVKNDKEDKTKTSEEIRTEKMRKDSEAWKNPIGHNKRNNK